MHIWIPRSHIWYLSSQLPPPPHPLSGQITIKLSQNLNFLVEKDCWFFLKRPNCDECLLFSFFLLKNVVECFCFLVCACSSGLFYINVIQTLRTRQQNERSKSLSIAFMVLWLSWVLFTIPYLTIDVIARVIMEKANNEYKIYYQYTDPKLFFDYIAERVFLQNDVEKMNAWKRKNLLVSFLFSAFGSMRHSYGFINSTLLVFLLRPFQKPLLAVVNLLKALITKVRPSSWKMN